MLLICKPKLLTFSSPGEALPPFPKQTHGGEYGERHAGGLLPLATVNDAIQHIPSGALNHDVDRAQPRQCPAYPADAPLRRCITTSGGQNYHPSGKRDFTLREFACLQGFPLDYEFGTTRVLRQIGNAVPPTVGKAFLEEVKKALLRADGLL